MIQLSRILCAVDFSRPARAAFARALALSREHNAELTVVQAVPVTESFGLRGRARMTHIAALRHAAEAAGVSLRVSVQHGDPAGVIVLHANARAFDLVIVGTHQRVGMGRLREGSVAERVIQRVTSPVLIVPADVAFREILCATDFSPGSVAALQKALVLVQRSGGRLTVLHVLDGFPYETVYSGSRGFRLIDEYRGLVAQVSRQLRQAIPQDALNWCDVQTRVVSGVPHRAILSTELEIKPDLIVMGMPARSALDTVFMGSTTGPVLRGATCPVLTVPVPAQTIESQTLVTSSRAPALDSDLYSKVPSPVSQTNRIEGLASW